MKRRYSRYKTSAFTVYLYDNSNAKIVYDDDREDYEISFHNQARDYVREFIRRTEPDYFNELCRELLTYINVADITTLFDEDKWLIHHVGYSLWEAAAKEYPGNRCVVRDHIWVYVSDGKFVLEFEDGTTIDGETFKDLKDNLDAYICGKIAEAHNILLLWGGQ